MKVPFLDLSREMGRLESELEAALGAVLARGEFVLGPAVEDFERHFAAYCGVDLAVGVASGTSALTIALQAVGVGHGDEVITAANTCVPTVAAIEAAGARPVLADVDPATYTLSPESVADAVTSASRAVVPVHLYGQCADMAPLLELARSRGLAVVEDAAQAHGAEYSGNRAGSLADAAAFSFYPTKNLGALGEGGAVVTNHEHVATEARLRRNFGQQRRDESVLRGTNARLDALQASVLTAKLAHLDGRNDRRRAIAAAYRRGLEGLPLLLPIEAAGRRHAYHLFVVRVEQRDRFRAHLRQAGIATLVHYPIPVHRQPAYLDLAPRDRSLGVTEGLAREIVSLPLYPELTDEEIAAVIEAARGALSATRRRTAGTHGPP